MSGHTAESHQEMMLLQQCRPFWGLDQREWQRELQDAMKKGREICLGAQRGGCLACDQVRKRGCQTQEVWLVVDP